MKTEAERDVGQDRLAASEWPPRRARDRATVDLRGIGDAVRAAAKARGATVAALAREALLAIADGSSVEATAASGAAINVHGATVKLTLRLSSSDAELLTHNARALGLSYGDYVTHLVRSTPLPQPAADREADRAALLRHGDRLAQWAIDAHSLARLLRAGHLDRRLVDAATGEAMTADIRRHLDLASKVLARCGAQPPKEFTHGRATAIDRRRPG